MDGLLDRELFLLEQSENYRVLDRFSGVNFELDFGHNDYLCLSKDARVKENAMHYLEKYGAGGTASRLCVNTDIYKEFENKIAHCIGGGRAIFMCSGYQVNSTLIPAILGLFPRDDIDIFSDKLNHNSILHGLSMANLPVKRYGNIDLNHLEFFLKKSTKKYKMVITESVFSMDGTVLELQNLLFLKEKYGLMIYLDEAHSFGLYGKNGYGFAEDFPGIDFAMGTFSKAGGAQGGYVVVPEKMYKYLVNKTPGLIYSTAVNPAVIGAGMKVLEILPRMQAARQHLSENVKFFRKSLANIGYSVGSGTANIVPVIFENRTNLNNFHKYLVENKIFALNIKHPTVPKNLERVRFSLNISHGVSDLINVVNLCKSWEK